MLAERNVRSLSGNLLILLAGGLVGAGIALLYAPLSGDETRRYLRMQTDRARTRTRTLTDTLKDTINELVDEARLNIDRMIDEGAELTKEKKAKFFAAIQAGKNATEEKRKKLGQPKP